MKPKKWAAVYPHGTKEGDEELAFFVALTRTKYQWRSTSGIVSDSGLTPERVEEIIQKYYKKGMIFQNPRNEDQWGYWERVPEMVPSPQKSISQADHETRLGKSSKYVVGCDLADNTISDQELMTLYTQEESDFKLQIDSILTNYYEYEKMVYDKFSCTFNEIIA